jgi:hypothetical protein
MAGEQKGFLGVFAFFDDLLQSLNALKREQVTIDTVYSPVRLEELREILHLKRSPVRFYTLTGGILGICVGLGLAIYTAMQWKFIVSGKPVIAWVPFMVLAFEFCILLGILFNVAGTLIHTRMPKITLPKEYNARFSEDLFGVVVRCSEAQMEKVRQILTHAGAEEVHEIA